MSYFDYYFHHYQSIIMTTKTELQNKAQKLETELQDLKSQLSSYEEVTIENASVGDVLEDGSIVLQKSKGLALLVAPLSTEVSCSWSKKFPEVFQKLEEQGFNPSHWFIPTKEQLELAYQNLPNGLSTPSYYWSSTEVCTVRAYYVGHDFKIALSLVKRVPQRVRAFRCVAY